MPKDIGKEPLEEKPYDIVSEGNMTRIRSISSKRRIQENGPQKSDSDILFCRS
jgi:hypothetical protein